MSDSVFSKYAVFYGTFSNTNNFVSQNIDFYGQNKTL